MSKEQFEAGLKCRTEVLGEEYVNKSLAGADDFNRDFQQMVTEYAWGGSWGRGLLEKRDRSILNLGMLAALNRPHEFKLHFKGAINNGLSLKELREILIQISIYCGVPAAIDAFRVAREALAELDIDPSSMDKE
ncbi:MAG: 4-carboxymuconolactone decarboxylase [Rhodospirillaceae bacterium]|jgi:4-carboxymuconolactone decarboxylase|nr:4-carboxymuconolactone decarboxylase [Rhodospirillaceae bacterium]